MILWTGTECAEKQNVSPAEAKDVVTTVIVTLNEVALRREYARSVNDKQ